MTSPEEKYDKRKPAVSVLLASYNSEAFIEKTLNSIRAQTFADFRCLISDDCSTDRTVELVEIYSNSDPRFRLLRNSENLGWIGNINQLLDIVDTEFFCMMPHDDLLAPRYLEALFEALLANPNAIVSFSDMEYFYLDGRREILSYDLEVNKGLEKKRSITMLRKGGHWWIPYRGMVRTRLTGNEFRLRNNLAGGAIGDSPWVLDLTMRGEFVRVREILYTKIVYEQSLSANWRYSGWEHIASFLSCIRAVMKGPLSLLDKFELILLLILKIFSQIFHRLIQTIKGLITRPPDF